KATYDPVCDGFDHDFSRLLPHSPAPCYVLCVPLSLLLSHSLFFLPSFLPSSLSLSLSLPLFLPLPLDFISCMFPFLVAIKETYRQSLFLSHSLFLSLSASHTLSSCAQYVCVCVLCVCVLF